MASIVIIFSHQAINCLLFLLLLLLKSLLVQWVRLDDPIVTLELGCDSVLRPDVVVVLEQDADVAAQLLIDLVVKNLSTHVVERPC